jgi:hypothetical protein
MKFDWDVSRWVIQNALQQAGYSRYKARRKSSISEKNRVERLIWAWDHV